LITGHKKLINKKAKFIKADIKNRKRLSTIIKKNNWLYKLFKSFLDFNELNINIIIEPIKFKMNKRR
jgi:UDP-glucose 4-epimerase